MKALKHTVHNMKKNYKKKLYMKKVQVSFPRKQKQNLIAG